jgi:hypothetical protein
MNFKRSLTRGWIVWLAASFALSVPWFLWHLRIFETIDPRFYRLLLIVLPGGIIAGWVYSNLRRRGWWRYEPVALAVLPLILGAVYAPLATLVTLWIVAAMAASGKTVLRWSGLDAEPGLSILTGFGLLSCLLFVLGVTGQFRWPWFLALLAALSVMGWRGALDTLSDLRRYFAAWSGNEEMKTIQVGVAVFAAFILEVMACMSWLTPLWSGDPLRFHLALVRSFLWSHSLSTPSAIYYGFFPQGFEVIATLGYALGGQYAAQAVNLLFFALVLMLGYSLARACGIDRSWAVAGVVVGASVPFLHWSGVTFKNDLALAAYELGALLCYFRWREHSKFQWIVLGTFFTAMSFGVKYVAVFGALPIFCLYGYAVWQTKRRVLAAAALCAVMLCFGLFWPARTYLSTGNPVYPMRAKRAVRPPVRRVRSNALLRLVSIPVLIYSEGKKHFESPSTEPAGIALLLLAPLWLLRAPAGPGRRSEAILWFYVLAYYIYWGVMVMVLRYAIVPIFLLVILAVARLGSPPRWAAISSLAAVFVFALPVLIVMEMAPAQVPLFLKKNDASAFLRTTLPPYGAVEFLDHQATAADHIASVGDWASAYAPNPAHFEHIYRTNRRYFAHDVAVALARSTSNYLILPKVPNLGELEAAARTDFNVDRIYSDDAFVAYKVSPKESVVWFSPVAEIAGEQK